MRRVITALLIAFVCVGFSDVQAQKKPRMQRVYMFGFAASFTDSICCLTDIQRIDSAWIEPTHKFLVDRSLYSLQLQNHMESVEGCKNAISSVFFTLKPNKLQRMWRKMRKRYERAEGLRFSVLPENRFRFAAEEYREIIIGDDVVAPPSAPVADKSKKSKKGK